MFLLVKGGSILSYLLSASQSNCSVECAVGSLKEMFTIPFKNMIDVYLGQVCEMSVYCEKLIIRKMIINKKR